VNPLGISYFSRKSAEHRAGTLPWAWADQAYRLGIAYRDKNHITGVISDYGFCLQKIKGGQFHRDEYRLHQSDDSEHEMPSISLHLFDWDHQIWFKDAQGRFIFTSQPYCPPEGRTELAARHQAFADRLGVAFRMSAEESWWYPGQTVLLEYRFPINDSWALPRGPS
jgi:hypothetical protein